MGEYMDLKATFKAERESLGLTQNDIAEELGVRILSVKRWENPGKAAYAPPEAAWDLLEEIGEKMVRTVDEAVNAVLENVPEGGSVQLTYYRTQEQYDEFGRDAGSVNVANANARRVAIELRRLGYTVGWAYPDSTTNVYHNAAWAVEDEIE